MTAFRFPAAGLLAAGLVALAGCGGGDDVADVTGTVTFDGKPLAKGAITFTATDGKGGSGGGEIKDGRYTATRVPVGPNTVRINGSKVIGKKKIYNTKDSQEMPLYDELLPKKYHAKSDLTLDVKPGSNEKNYELTK